MLARVGLVALSLSISRLAGAFDGEPEPAPEASARHSVVSGAQLAATPRSRRTSWTGDRLALLAHVGIGAPGGALGLDLDVAPIPYLALGASVGVSPGEGLQLALMPRLRAPLGTLAGGQKTFLTFGAGVSLGRYVNDREVAGLGALFLGLGDGESPATQRYERALWTNFEVGLDVYSLEGRGFFRTTLGFGQISNDRDYTCSAREGGGSYPPSGDCDRDSGQGLAFFTLAYGFDL